MTSRSARGISIYCTQSIPNFYAEMGGDGTARARVDSLLANLQTRIACQSLDFSTNYWYSEAVGKVIVRRQSRSVTTKNFVESFLAANEASGKPASISISEQADYDISPRAFTGLKRGGHAMNGIIEAILVSAGERFRANGKRWLRISFDQFKEPMGWRRFTTRHVLITAPRLKG